MEIRTVRGQQIHPVRQGGGQPEPRPGDRLLPQRCGLVGGHRDPGTLRRGTGLPIETQGTRPYFEVLLVEDMPDTQERALREELRKWRRPDDELAHELVIVHNIEDALIAGRLNYTIQACVIRRRFAQRSGRGPVRAELVHRRGAPSDLMEQSPDSRANMLGRALAGIRPELDLT
jgi:hypothetical protein